MYSKLSFDGIANKWRLYGTLLKALCYRFLVARLAEVSTFSYSISEEYPERRCFEANPSRVSLSYCLSTFWASFLVYLITGCKSFIGARFSGDNIYNRVEILQVNAISLFLLFYILVTENEKMPFLVGKRVNKTGKHTDPRRLAKMYASILF